MNGRWETSSQFAVNTAKRRAAEAIASGKYWSDPQVVREIMRHSGLPMRDVREILHAAATAAKGVK